MNAVTLRTEKLTLRLLPDLGCRWTSLEANSHGRWVELLEGGENLADPLFGGAFLMAPWCNRVSKGRFVHDGRAIALRQNFPDGSAIHGDVYARPWRVNQVSESALTATFDSQDVQDFNFPARLSFTTDIMLHDGSCRLEFTIENKSPHEVPVGFGLHPTFRNHIDGRGAELQVPARKWIPTDEGAPLGPPVDVPRDRSLEDARPALHHEWDDLYTSITGPVILDYPGVARLEMELGENLDFVMVYAPLKHLGAPAQFLCVEPQSMMNDGYRRRAEGWGATGVQVLKPEAAFKAQVRLSVS